MTEHTVTRTVQRVEEQTVDKDGYVQSIDIVDVSQSKYECSCGVVLETVEDVEDHLP